VHVDADGGTTKRGYIDRTGKWVIELPRGLYPYGPFREGLAPVLTSAIHPSRVGYIDRTGKVVINPQFGPAEDWTAAAGGILSFHDGLARAAVASRRGYIDKTGKLVWQSQE
jgi:hypothetical protein